MTPTKRLVQESFEFLRLVNSNEYREIQNKFDSLYSEIKKDQNMLLMVQKELKETQKFRIKPVSEINIDNIQFPTLILPVVDDIKLTGYNPSSLSFLNI
ncbi:hypothetical protein [Arcobacter peruensis]|uniref:hypothetical protein n=1 Tax=Arcobacter peruensis TaxID=2320140 RepID=UPI000F0865E5|nr:hypothetical protein [Arcobacter peruensis]